MKPTLRITALIALLLAPTALLAQTWYKVELIVFRQWEAGGADAEATPMNPPPPQADRVTDLAPANSGSGTPFRQLTDNQLSMHGIYKALAQSNAYEPLMHIGWVQPGRSAAQAPWVAIPAGWQPQEGGFGQQPPVYGLIQVYVERFLHVRTDLRYRQGDGDGGVHVMQEGRRMRSGELHYLDHPAMGIIVQATPL